jgi:hypothetical protein
MIIDTRRYLGPVFIPVPLPDPEVLLKYVKPAGAALHSLREKTKAKGREHGKYLRSALSANLPKN